MNFKKYLILILTITIISSCTDELADLNIDPNNSPSANPQQVLSSAEAFIGYSLDAQFNVRSALWAQYWTWGPGVAIGNIERYVSDGTDYDNGWTRMYSGAIADLEFVENSSAKSHAGIAKILKAYCFQLLVDNFGDVPFSEANKGASELNFAPKYDKDSDIYAALIPLIDEGISLLGTGEAVGAEDFIFNGSTAQWTKFANSLKLRILMRQSGVNDVSNQVKALISEGNFIETQGDIAAMPFSGISGSENPMYASFERSLGLFYIASSSSMDYLKGKSDPRISAFYKPAVKTGTFVSISQGSVDNEPFTNNKDFYSLANIKAYAKDNSVILMSPWEVWFLRAEAAVKFGTSDNSNVAFSKAIESNFTYLGVADGADFATVLDLNGQSSNDAKIQLIGSQKWVSMNGTQENEGWIESRRFNTSANPFFYRASNGIFKKPTLSVLGDGVHPSILLYPQTEMSLNSSAPAQRDLLGKVFWDN